MRRVIIRIALAVVTIPLLALGAWSFYNRAAFGTWNPADLPTRISYCERTYLPGAHVARARIDEVGNGLGRYPIVQVGTTAGGLPYFAKPLPKSVRYMYGSPPLPCDMAVYLRVGADDYVDYGLSGGP